LVVHQVASTISDIMNNSDRQLSVVNTFHKLHESGCFVIPNPFDIGSAIYLHHLGFKALATSSAGFAFTRGLPDDVNVIALDVMLEHFREVAEAIPLPVNADFQNGYADEPDAVAENVSRCVATGVAGLSIEDRISGSARQLYDDDVALARIKAARKAIDESGMPVVLTARCEVYLVENPNPFDFAIRRLSAFAEAGADCLYAPGVTDPKQIETIVKAVAPRAVNVLAFRPDPNLSLARLTELGVRRISVGSALARVAWTAFINSASDIARTGEFTSLTENSSLGELNQLFKQERAAGSN
jgi:2-methylisocitrate lyase-like PEP mutase family enzyme